jgi:hypothetical protein
LALTGEVLSGRASKASWQSQVGTKCLLVVSQPHGYNSLRKHYWLAVSPLYGYLAFYLLWHLIPPFVDGSGPLPTFYWGSHEPTPTLSEYDQNPTMQFWFLLPYWVASLIITVLACEFTPRMVRRSTRLSSSPFCASSSVALALMLSAAAISDLGIWFHVWDGHLLLADFYSAYLTLRVAVAMSMLTGLLAVGRKRLAT